MDFGSEGMFWNYLGKSDPPTLRHVKANTPRTESRLDQPDLCLAAGHFERCLELGDEKDYIQLSDERQEEDLTLF